MSDDPICLIAPDEILYRASAVGSCIRALWAGRSGYEQKPPTAKMQAIFDRGHELEPIILDKLRVLGWTFDDLQGEVSFQVTTLESGLLLSVRGHYDAMGQHEQFTQGEWLPVDVKGFGPDLVKEYLGNQLRNLSHYSWQQSIYAIGCGAKRFVMPVYDKDNDMILRSSMFPMDPEFTIEDIEVRLLGVEQLYRESVMPPCVNNYPCPFYYLHDEPEVKPELPKAVAQLTTARMKVDAKIKVMTKAKDRLTEAILNALGMSAQSYDYDGTIVAVQPNSERFNTDAAKAVLREAGVDINTPEFKIPGDGYKLVVTPPKPPKHERKTDT